MRTSNQKINEDRFKVIPRKGYPEVRVLEVVLGRCSETQSDYRTGHPMAKPGTFNAQVAEEAYALQMRYQNGNLVDGKMFPGAFRTEADVISMTANLLQHPNLDAVGGFMLGGGTESISQALWIMSRKYFGGNYGVDVGREGIQDAIEQIQRKRLGYYPVILAPVGTHFALEKVADLQGYGRKKVVRYGLEKDFTTDFSSLERVVRNAYESGGEIMVSFCNAGDVEKGKVQSVSRVDRVVSELAEAYRRPRPKVIVDAAPQFLFLSVLRDSTKYGLEIPKWDFSVEAVQGIVCDWHKNRVPYNAGALVLRDAHDLLLTNQFAAYLHNNSSVDMGPLNEGERIRCGVASSIPTSRGAGGTFGTFAYLLTEGIEGLRRSKEEVWRITQLFAEQIKKSKHYKLICAPQTSVVAFELKENRDRHERVYDTLNNDPADNLFISHSDTALVRTPEELEQCRDLDEETKEKRYSGLHVHIMEHNNEESVHQTIKKLEDLATKIK